MPHPALALALSLPTLMWSGPLEQEGRTKVQVVEPRPTPSVLTLAEKDHYQQIQSSRAKVVPSVVVLVEGKALSVPEPPTDAKYARARLNAVTTDCAEAKAAIDLELKSLYEAQKQQISALKAHPETGTIGHDTPLHVAMWRLLKSTSYQEQDQILKRGTLEVLQRMGPRQEGDESAFAQAQRSAYNIEPNTLDGEFEVRHYQLPGRAFQAFRGSAFLKDYAPVWEAYAPHLRSYLLEASQLLGESESIKDQPATDVLSRALRIQFLERVRALVDYNQHVWTLAASHVPPDYWYHSLSRSGVMPYSGVPSPVGND